MKKLLLGMMILGSFSNFATLYPFSLFFTSSVFAEANNPQEVEINCNFSLYNCSKVQFPGGVCVETLEINFIKHKFTRNGGNTISRLFELDDNQHKLEIIYNIKGSGYFSNDPVPTESISFSLKPVEGEKYIVDASFSARNDSKIPNDFALKDYFMYQNEKHIARLVCNKQDFPLL